MGPQSLCDRANTWKMLRQGSLSSLAARVDGYGRWTQVQRGKELLGEVGTFLESQCLQMCPPQENSLHPKPNFLPEKG